MSGTARHEHLRQQLGGRLAFGGDYNPEQWPEATWPDDVSLMQEAGVNLVTVGVFSWARLQPEPKRWDFGWLDRILDLLHEGGIAVDLATATASPPPWLARLDASSLPVTADGVRLGTGSRQQYCPSSQSYREAGAKLTTALAARYGTHPALALWHVGNEYGAHVDACYCDRSAEDFRSWLKDRYGDISLLNASWGTSVWSQSYLSFDEVGPPRRAPYFLNPAQQLDFRRFSSDALLACFTAERDILHRITPSVPVTTNFMGLFKPLDYWRWAAEEDVVSHDSYPDLEDPAAPIRNALAADLMRSLRHGQPWMLMEQAPGSINWRKRNPPKPAGVFRLWSYQAIARGADGVLQFQWRASRQGTEKFHSAMVPHAGPDSRIFREACALGRELAGEEGIAGTPVTAQVAMLATWESWWALEMDSRPSGDVFFVDQLLCYYEPLWQANVTIDVRRPDDDLSGYRLVVVPNLYLLSEHSAARLSDYVRAGGHLVVSYFTGIVDESESIHPGGLAAPLRELLGVNIEEWWPLMADETVELTSRVGPRTGTGSLWSEVVAPHGADVIATFATGELAGSPAVTRHPYGLGVAIYVATRPDPRYLAALLRDVRSAAQVEPTSGEQPAGVEIVQRGEALFVLNHQRHAVTVVLRTETFEIPPLGVRIVRRPS